MWASTGRLLSGASVRSGRFVVTDPEQLSIDTEHACESFCRAAVWPATLPLDPKHSPTRHAPGAGVARSGEFVTRQIAAKSKGLEYMHMRVYLAALQFSRKIGDRLPLF